MGAGQPLRGSQSFLHVILRGGLTDRVQVYLVGQKSCPDLLVVLRTIRE